MPPPRDCVGRKKFFLNLAIVRRPLWIYNTNAVIVYFAPRYYHSYNMANSKKERSNVPIGNIPDIARRRGDTTTFKVCVVPSLSLSCCIILVSAGQRYVWNLHFVVLCYGASQKLPTFYSSSCDMHSNLPGFDITKELLCENSDSRKWGE